MINTSTPRDLFSLNSLSIALGFYIYIIPHSMMFKALKKLIFHGFVCLYAKAAASNHGSIESKLFPDKFRFGAAREGIA
jgi:hypothetical protein